MKTYRFPVWGTQGGGLVRRSGDQYVFVEAPRDVPSLDVGDLMPSEWGVIPANDLAAEELEEEEAYVV
ncbi:MAG: hypothetical protein Q7S64_02820 [bacterium]|nr:hypothetical protein [bacterium]